VLLQREHALPRRHHLARLHAAVRKRALDDVALLCHAALLHVHLDQVVDARARVAVALFLAQRPVQHQRERLGEGVEEEQEGPHDGHRLGAYFKAVARAKGLRHDLPKHNHQYGGEEEANQARGEVRNQNGL